MGRYGVRYERVKGACRFLEKFVTTAHSSGIGRIMITQEPKMEKDGTKKRKRRRKK